LNARQRLGLDGEAQAEEFLRRAGFTILDRRFRCRAGEIDLVALDGEVVVFVEVKARRGVGYGTPTEAVVPRKQRRLAWAALTWLARMGRLESRSRFDVVEVLAPAGRASLVRHVEDAFRPPHGGRRGV
jgi:putative endonuclease